MTVPYPASCTQGARVTITPPGVVRLGAVARSRNGDIAAFRLDAISPGTAKVVAIVGNQSAGGLVVTVPDPQPGSP